MKYEMRVNVMKVDEYITKLTDINNAVRAEKREAVRDALYAAYDQLLDELIELIGTQLCESMKEVK